MVFSRQDSLNEMVDQFLQDNIPQVQDDPILSGSPSVQSSDASPRKFQIQVIPSCEEAAVAKMI